MTDKEKIADAANNVENRYIKNIPENFWFLRFLGQYMQGHKGFIAGGCFKNILSREKVKDVDIFQYLLGNAHIGIRVMAITSVENQRKSYLTLLEIQHLKMMSYRRII